MYLLCQQFAKYQEIHSIGSVRDIFKRACTVHLTRKPSIHLAWAAFEERQGYYAQLKHAPIF